MKHHCTTMKVSLFLENHVMRLVGQATALKHVKAKLCLKEHAQLLST